MMLTLFAPEATRANSSVMVTFTFDDVPKSVFTVGFPILEKYHYPATIYVETRNTTFNGYMNWDDVGVVAKAGWEIGAHTHTHPHLTKLTNEEILEDLLISTQEFAAHGYAPQNFASPFGDMDERVLAIIKRHYASQRAAWPNGVNVGELDPYNIQSYAISKDTTWEEMSNLLDGLQREGGWLVLQMHDVTPKGVTVGQQYDTNLLEDIVEEVHSRGFPVITIRQALENLQ